MRLAENRERSRAKRGAAVPARPAETCAQHLAVTDEHRATGDVVAAVASKAGSSTCAAGAPGEGVPATAAARSSVAAGPVAGSPAPAPVAAGSVDASCFTAAPAVAGPGVARADSSAQNRRAELVVAAPGSEHDQRTTPGSAQNQQAARVPDRSGARTSRYAGSVDAGSPASGPAAADSSVAPAGGSAPNRQARTVATPGSEQVRCDTRSSAQNQQAPRAGKGPSRTDAELHCGVRARLSGDRTASQPPAPESARARRGRRHIPAASS